MHFLTTSCDGQQPGAELIAPVQGPQTLVELSAIRWFCRSIHERAAAIANSAGIKDARLVLSSYGEIPAGAANWRKIAARNKSFAIGEHQAMAGQAIDWAPEPGRNVYLSLAIYPNNLGGNKRGRASDAFGIFGLGADLDRDKGCNVRIEDLPLAPTIVISSSREPGENFNLLWLLDRPLTVEEARPIAKALAAVVGDADGGTADPIHVWRVPGTLNWPKKLKVERGRPLAPQVVRVDGAGGIL
jgi:hypothetical protein